mmetsp:Transcript_10666/g.20237  ORF Transcript_10666/g.20237 Transcript_10666/m.20237 type:complete len:213 (-) Transcript_10666:959-1597(-)
MGTVGKEHIPQSIGVVVFCFWFVADSIVVGMQPILLVCVGRDSRLHAGSGHERCVLCKLVVVVLCKILDLLPVHVVFRRREVGEYANVVAPGVRVALGAAVRHLGRLVQHHLAWGVVVLHRIPVKIDDLQRPRIGVQVLLLLVFKGHFCQRQGSRDDVCLCAVDVLAQPMVLVVLSYAVERGQFQALDPGPLLQQGLQVLVCHFVAVAVQVP